MDNSETLAYDLRQIYAVDIVGTHLKLCTEHRINKNYPEYFNALENLYVVVSHKFKGSKDKETQLFFKAIKGDKKTDIKTDIQIYNGLREHAINKCNEHNNAFQGRSKDAKQVSEIEEALKAIEKYLYRVMDKAKMFGAGSYVEGL